MPGQRNILGSIPHPYPSKQRLRASISVPPRVPGNDRNCSHNWWPVKDAEARGQSMILSPCQRLNGREILVFDVKTRIYPLLSVATYFLNKQF